MITHKVRPRDTEIFIGKQGENNARQILFKASYFRTEGTGEFVLLHQRHGDTAPYPVTITEDDEYVVWTVTSADVANAGSGKCELQYLENDDVVKSRTWTTRTFEALEEAGEVPDPETGWIAKLLSLLSEDGAGLPDVSDCEDGTVLVTRNGYWVLLHIGLEDITEEDF